LNDKINGNGNITSTDRTVTGFTGILLEGAGDINIHFSANFKVIVTTDSNIQDIVTIEVTNNLLYVDEKRGDGINPTKLVIDVYLPELENITLKGAGNIKIDNGNSSTLSLILSGAGNIEAQNYRIENVNVILSGTGNIKTWVTNNLSGNISGVGNIYYKGNPTKNVIITGIGNIKEL
jgi:hypothetical protein